MASSTAIELTKTPKNKDYEDYVCAYLLAGGMYFNNFFILKIKFVICPTLFPHQQNESIMVYEYEHE
jgi:hypothetical protein